MTDSMVQAEEEARLEEERDLEEERQQFEAEKVTFGTNEQRVSRLKHLLEKSSLYSDFLFKRMKEQEAERNAKEMRAKKKSEKPSRSSETSSKRHARGKLPEKDIILADYAAEALESSKAKTGSEQPTPEVVDTFRRKLKDGSAISDLQSSLVSGGVLRDYQLQGVEWLKALFENGLNGILADEMGLGKTVQVISFFAHLYEMKVRGPFLIVTPLSTLGNWINELKRFTPNIPVVLYHGSPTERAEKRKLIQQLRKGVGFPTVVTSFEVVMKDRRFLANLGWKYMVVDEGHRIKNLNCRLIKDLKSFQSSNRLLLTGTPLQNNLSELWSLLNFLLPDIFDDLESFQRWFDFSADDAMLAKEEQEHILTKLHQVLKPFLLRRLKTDVELSIPAKKEVVLFTALTALQEEYYKGVLNRTILEQIAARSDQEPASLPTQPLKRRSSEGVNYAELSEDDIFATMHATKSSRTESRTYAPASNVSDVHIRLQNILMQLRKCCNHPYLLEYPLTPAGEYKMDEELVTSSGKMQLLDAVLPKLKRNGHKVLIFSQMTKMLDVLQDYCFVRDYSFVRLDGSVNFTERQSRIESFNGDPSVFVFLLSTRAGGLGLNLTAADTVIIYDSDWNPQADLQAQDRCHRIGQTKPVLVLRLVSANTVDERILQRAESKRKLEKLVIHHRRFKGKGHEETALTAPELLELLTTDATAEGSGSLIATPEVIACALDRSDAHPVAAGPAETELRLL